MKIGLALGGGGARGYAHIGVIKALSAKGLKPDIIAGTSMGSIVGAMYSQSEDISDVESRFREFLQSEDFKKLSIKYLHNSPKDHFVFSDIIKRDEERLVINLSASELSLFNKEYFVKSLDLLLADGVIEENKMTFAAVCADLISGRKVILGRGDIKTAVLASSSIPAVLPPVVYDSMHLVDGEVVELIPCDSVRELGAEYVIAVDVRMDLPADPPLVNVLDIHFRANQVKSRVLSDRVLAAEVIIQPDVGSFHWTCFEDFDVIVKAGYDAAEQKVEEIINQLS